MSTPAAGPGPARLARLARKELTEVLRDRRTVLTLLLMPLLLYPLMAVVFRQFLISRAVGSEPPEYRLGFRTEDEAQAVDRYLTLGVDALQRRGAFGKPGPDAKPDVRPQPKFKAVLTDALDAEIKRGAIDVGVRTVPSGPFRHRAGEDLAVELELVYRDDSVGGVDAARYLQRVCREANAVFLSRRLSAVGVDQRPDPVRPVLAPLPNPEGRRSQVFAVLLPLVLILMTITGAVYPAIDLTAGERERGTLEVLIAAPVPRWALLAAKYVAVVSVAVLTALMNLGSMTLTLWATGLGQAVLDEKALTVWLLPEVFGLLLLLAAFFSGVLLALTSFARTFKEAQAYLIPLMLASLMPGMIGLVPGLRLEGPLAVAPLINIVLLARDLLEGAANPVAAAVVVLTTVLYAVAAVAVAARTFGAEAVLSTEQGGWRELFRRPRQPRDTATAAGALLCLALMFPASLVLSRLVVEFRGGPVTDLLAEQGLATVALFGVFPLVAARLGHVRPLTGFRLAAPGVSACLAGLVLGLCLWPLVHELELLLRAAGLTTLGEEQLKAFRQFLEELRTAPVALVVFVLGVLTPVLEELFFRGYLFGALLAARGPRTAVLVSAFLFGLFHLLTGGGIAVEKLIASTLLGVVLGWLCWKSGSVVPGVLLHATHNSVLTLLGLYEPWLQEWGWPSGEEDHLPGWVLLTAVAGAALGALGVWFLPRPATRLKKDAAG